MNPLFSEGRILPWYGKVAPILVIGFVMWATGIPALLPFAQAAALTSFSDTLSQSGPSRTSNHAFAFTTTTGMDDNDTIVINFDPTGSLFAINNLAVTDVTGESGLDVVTACTASPSEVTMATTSTSITFTVCTGDTLAAGAKTFTLSNNRITNPGVVNSYIIRVRTTNDGSTIRDSGDTRVAIVDNVTVTAQVDTSFTFTVAGVNIGQTVNGDATTTATTTTATSIPFGLLTPGEAKVAAQQLSVTTNSRNGFTVTVVEDQNLTSQTGADIDLFIDGATTSSPTAWQAPANTLDQENTYGHIGVTTEDSTLSDGDSFGSALYAGNFITPREIFYHTGPADGTTANKGRTRVAYKVEIGTLQEAGNDYTNTLTYVATPVF